MIGSLGYSGAAGELNKRGTVVCMELVHQHLHSHYCSFCPRELIADDGPSSRVLNESWAGGGKISLGWDSVQPNSHSLVSASWDSTIKNCKNWNCPLWWSTLAKKAWLHTISSWHTWLWKPDPGAKYGLEDNHESWPWVSSIRYIFKMIYPPNHSVHMSLHRKALTLWFFY